MRLLSVTKVDERGVAPSNRLRGAALATSFAGITTMVAAGVVPAVAGFGTALLVAGSATLSARLTSPDAYDTRRRAAVLALALASVAALASSGGTISDSTGSVLGLLLCAAAIAHSLVLDTVRDLRVNVAVSLSTLLLAAGLAPGLSIALPVVVTWGCAVVALVLASAENQGAGASSRAIVTRGASSSSSSPFGGSGSGDENGRGWASIATYTAVAVLVGLAVSLVLPHPPGVSARSSFGAGTERSHTTAGSSSRSAGAYLGGPLSLDNRGQLPDTPIAVVTGGSGALWRASVLGTYDGHGWWPALSGSGSVLSAGATTVTVPPDPASPPQPHPSTQRDGVGWLGAAEPVVISPGLPTSIDLRSDGRVVREADGRLLLSSGTSTPSYTVTSNVVPRVETVSGPEVGRDANEAVWRSLPASLPERVTELARQITAGSPTRAAAVRAVETYLRTNYKYDLNSPVAPAGADSVDDFLFDSRTGFCEHFASAEVVLLRSVGIPSRVSTGFAAEGADADGHVVLRAKDSHAWAEVWIEGTGWVSSDPTAGAQLAHRSSTGITGTIQKLLDAATGSLTRKIVIAVLLVLVAVVALLLPGLLRRRRRAAASKAVPSSPLFAAFHRFEEALERTGAPRAPAESVRALAARGPDDPDVVDALLTVERASYAATPPTREEVRIAADAIDRASARLLADADSH